VERDVVELSYVVETDRLVEPMLMRFVVCQQDALADMGESLEAAFQQLTADTLALIRRVHQDVLHIDDRDIVAEHASQTNQMPLFAGYDDEGRIAKCLVKMVRVVGVDAPADRVVQLDELAYIGNQARFVLHLPDRSHPFTDERPHARF